MANQPLDICDKIRELVDERRNQKCEAVVEALKSALQEAFDDGAIEEQINEDKTSFEVITIDDLNDVLHDDGYVVDTDFIETYVEDGFVIGENNMIMFLYE